MNIFDQQFVDYWCARAKENWGTWPHSSTWPSCGTAYSAVQVDTPDGPKTYLKFDAPVKSETGFQFEGKKWVVKPGNPKKKRINNMSPVRA